METRSNHVLVGGVVLILLAVLALFMVWISRFGAEGKREYDILFKQSVDGLAKGSAVNFSGVPIGQVKDIKLDAKSFGLEGNDLLGAIAFEGHMEAMVDGDNGAVVLSPGHSQRSYVEMRRAARATSGMA